MPACLMLMNSHNTVNRDRQSKGIAVIESVQIEIIKSICWQLALAEAQSWVAEA